MRTISPNRINLNADFICIAIAAAEVVPVRPSGRPATTVWKADINIAADDGATALVLAARNGYVEGAERLTGVGATLFCNGRCNLLIRTFGSAAAARSMFTISR
jgi:hypothetical protein